MGRLVALVENVVESLRIVDKDEKVTNAKENRGYKPGKKSPRHSLCTFPPKM